jgi:hypothetical protein
MGIFVSLIAIVYNYYKVDKFIPVSLTGVHHMGSDYRIAEFYVDKYSGGAVGEGGGGGSMVCCVLLPKKWYPGLKAYVRWEVRHIIRPTDPATPETEEVAGIYHARVPVEPYREVGDFYVHFFSKGAARIVVSEFGPHGQQHPIQSSDSLAGQAATVGSPIKSLFTAEELAEFEREAVRDRAKNGDWR